MVINQGAMNLFAKDCLSSLIMNPVKGSYLTTSFLFVSPCSLYFITLKRIVILLDLCFTGSILNVG